MVSRPSLLTDRMHVIKRGASALSYREILPNMRIRPYVIGFPSVIHARKVQYFMAPEPSLRLYRSCFDNVSEQVNAGLEHFGIPKIDTHVVLDTEARLHIPKSDIITPFDNHPLNDGSFYVAVIPIEDFLMYPFDKNIGIIMPYELEKEDDNEIIFISSVVESTDSVKAFRNQLRLDQ